MDYTLKCCFCENNASTNKHELKKHIYDIHKIKSTGTKFKCAINKCQVELTGMSSFMKHIDRIHNLPKKEPENTIPQKNWIPSEINFDLIVAKSIADLRKQPSITGATIGNFVSELENIISAIMKQVKEKIEEFLIHQNTDMSHSDVTFFLKQFNFNSSFSKYKRIEGQIAALQENYTYIEPESKYLGGKNDHFM